MTAGPQDPDPDAQWQVRLPPSDPQAADQYLPQPGQQRLDPAPGQQWQDAPQDQQAHTWQQPGQQWQGGYGAQYQMRPVVAPRSPALGVLLSFFIPGLGSMVNGRPAKGVLILITYFIGWALILVLIGVPMLFGAWVWGMVDGYKAAQAWNRSHGIIS